MGLSQSMNERNENKPNGSISGLKYAFIFVIFYALTCLTFVGSKFVIISQINKNLLNIQLVLICVMNNENMFNEVKKKILNKLGRTKTNHFFTP